MKGVLGRRWEVAGEQYSIALLPPALFCRRGLDFLQMSIQIHKVCFSTWGSGEVPWEALGRCGKSQEGPRSSGNFLQTVCGKNCYANVRAFEENSGPSAEGGRAQVSNTVLLFSPLRFCRRGLDFLETPVQIINSAFPHGVLERSGSPQEVPGALETSWKPYVEKQKS